MNQLTSIKPNSVLAKLNWEKHTLENHSSIVVLGSGETGYLNFGNILNNKKFHHYETMLISNEPINWMNMGKVLFSMKKYNDLDFEQPLIKCYQHRNMKFDEVVKVDSKQQLIYLFSGDVISYDYLIINSGWQSDEWNPIW